MINLQAGNGFSRSLSVGFSGNAKNSAPMNNAANSPSFAGQKSDSVELSNRSIHPKKLGIGAAILTAMGLSAGACEPPELYNPKDIEVRRAVDFGPITPSCSYDPCEGAVDPKNTPKMIQQTANLVDGRKSTVTLYCDGHLDAEDSSFDPTDPKLTSSLRNECPQNTTTVINDITPYNGVNAAEPNSGVLKRQTSCINEGSSVGTIFREFCENKTADTVSALKKGAAAARVASAKFASRIRRA